jgi:hypothetical protein
LDKEAEAFKAVYSEIFKKRRDTKEARWVLNQARNEMKHMTVGTDGDLKSEHEVAQLDPLHSAVEMLTRAIENYALTGSLTENMQRFHREQLTAPPWPSRSLGRMKST